MQSLRTSKVQTFYFYGLSALIVFGIVVELFVSAGRETSYFSSPVERAINLFAYFTILSNIIIAVTSYLFAKNHQRTSNWFWGWYLSGLIAIIITFIVQHTVLNNGDPIHGWPLLSDTIVHTISPVLTVIGGLFFTPRGFVKQKTVLIAMIFPITWLVFTFVRGAFIDWYPYSFLDISKIGYLESFRNVGIITVIFFVLAEIAEVTDNFLQKRSRP